MAMAQNAGQIGKDRRIVNIAGAYVKKMTARKRRRAAKRDPENAPKKSGYDGWVA
jgi:hypothetical protein